MLIVTDIVKEYTTPAGTQPVLSGCSFQLEPGQSLSITGPSGSGKSTLLSIIGTLERPTSGSVTLHERVISELADNALPGCRRDSIGFIFQNHQLLPQLSVMENVAMPFLAEGGMTEERRAVALRLLERVGLKERLHLFPSRLSEGERQRVAIARALVRRPQLLIADEPTGNLNRDQADAVMSLLLGLSQGIMLVLATNDTILATRTMLRFELRQGRFQKFWR